MLLSMDALLRPIYVGSMFVCLNIPNFAFVSVDFIIFRNTILYVDLRFFFMTLLPIICSRVLQQIHVSNIGI